MRLLHAVLDALFPPKCAVCGEVLERRSASALCPTCRTEWERAKYSRCPACGMPCARCRCASSDMYRAGIRDHIKLTFYASGGGGTVNRVIYALKRANNRRLMESLSRECAAALTEACSVRPAGTAELLITYPGRTARARRAAGYDHARCVARGIARELGIEFTETLCRRGGVPQKTLDLPERRQNAAASLFSLPSVQVRDRTVVVFDDVVTSGATMARAAQLLYEQGAREVIALSVARSARSPGTDE